MTLVFGGDDSNFVRWGSLGRTGRRGPSATINWTPISVAPILQAALWKEPRSVGAALISATLSTDGGFGYVRKRLGISDLDPNVTDTIVGSPFDYANRCLLYVPRHLPMPSDDPGYAYDSANEMIALIEASHGGAFLLFTSYRALNAAYDHLTQSDLPYPLLRQGEMPNGRLVQLFKEEKNAVLLGTQSFWEGVDVPGADLRLVIIDRLPFAVPDSPLHKARVDEITAAGGDWFGDFALPQAQLKLKQGFGRLIRTSADRAWSPSSIPASSVRPMANASCASCLRRGAFLKSSQVEAFFPRGGLCGAVSRNRRLSPVFLTGKPPHVHFLKKESHPYGI